MDEGEMTKISAQEEADLSSALIAKLLAEDGGGGGRYSGYYDDYGNAAAFNDAPDECVSGSEADDDWDPNLKRRRKLKESKSRKSHYSGNAQNEAADIASGSSDLSDTGSQKKPKRSKKAKPGPRKEKAPPQPVMPGQYRSGAYTDEEEQQFCEGLEKFGRSWSEISSHVVTRDAKSIRSHAQKYFIKLFRDKVPLPAKVRESGEGYTLSGRPLDPNSAAARPYLQHVMQLDPLPESKSPEPVVTQEAPNVESNTTTDADDKEVVSDKTDTNNLTPVLAADNTPKDESESPIVGLTETEDAPPKSPVRTLYAMSRPQRSQIRPVALRYNDPHQMVRCTPFAAPPLSKVAGSQPFKLVAHTNAQLAMDFHAHLMLSEVIGLLGGHWDAKTRVLTVTRAFPCTALETNDAHTNVEMDPESELVVRSQIIDAGLRVVGWYHSHPTFRPDPSIIDIENQTSYQALFRDSESSEEPFVGAIVSPYDPELPRPASVLNWFYVGKTAVDRGHPKSLQVETTFDDELPLPDQEMLLQLFDDTRTLKHSASLEEAWRPSSTELRSLKMVVSLSHRMPWLYSSQKPEIETPSVSSNESIKDVELPMAVKDTTEPETASIDDASDCTATEPVQSKNDNPSTDTDELWAVDKHIPQAYLLTGQRAIQDQFLLGLYRRFTAGIFKAGPTGEVANAQTLGRIFAAYHYSSRPE